ncbi:hypothetical protein L2U69_11775 [Zavarzinia compransoris]|uniref:hypothetical protein n=1 Tax=Zavarzinia marina TaxID=2911065 RepID=UPI001F47D781|nr:hypothetical protein [Zavarzinia marina]MCF4166325.1 hypothetical protein [Zavarzinia marina]
MADRFVAPYFVWQDASGVPLAGAKLYFYASGTSTPKATFADSDMSTPNANPVVSDATGRFPSVFLAVGQYKVILHDADDILVWSADPVTAREGEALEYLETTTVTGAGLATGGGNLLSPIVITVDKASSAEVIAGVNDNKAITPAGAAAVTGPLNSRVAVLEGTYPDDTLSWPQPFGDFGDIAEAISFDSVDNVVRAFAEGQTLALFDGQLGTAEISEIAVTTSNAIPWPQPFGDFGDIATDIQFDSIGTTVWAYVENTNLNLEPYDVTAPEEYPDTWTYDALEDAGVLTGSISKIGADGTAETVSLDWTVETVAHIETAAGPRYKVTWQRPAAGTRETVVMTRACDTWGTLSDRVLHVWIGTGQSVICALSATDLISVNNPFPGWVLMLDTDAVRGDSDVRGWVNQGTGGDFQSYSANDADGFKDLAAHLGRPSEVINPDTSELFPGGSLHGQTVMESFLPALHRRVWAELGVKQRYLGMVWGHGGSAYDSLKKGSVPYTNMITALTDAVAIAAAQGWVIQVDGIINVHGETDDDNPDYDDDLIEWQSDAEADIKAVTGQEAGVPFFICGVSSNFTVKNESLYLTTDAVLAAYAAGAPITHYLVDTRYAELLYAANNVDKLHLAAIGQFHLGEKIARAVWEAQYTAAGLAPLALDPTPVSVAGAVATFKILGGEDVEIDTTTITQRTGTLYGLQHNENGEADMDNWPSLVSATIDNDVSGERHLIVTSSQNWASGDALDVGLKGYDDPDALNRVDFEQRPRTNIRTISYITSTYPGAARLHRWLAHERVYIP